jgi:hypothetical protein
MFEQAARMKLRFDTPVGVISVEDLWDLPLTSKTNRVNLDDIARGFSRELKSQEEESFVVKPPKADQTLALGFKIVKHVIDTLLEERKVLKTALDKKEQKNKIMAIMASKKDDELKETSVEDLQKMLDKL